MSAIGAEGYLDPETAIRRLADPFYRQRFSLMVKHWPDGDVSCVMTESYAEQTFHECMGYELVSRAGFVEAVRKLVHVRTSVPYGAFRGGRKAHVLATVLPSGVPDQPSARDGTGDR